MMLDITSSLATPFLIFDQCSDDSKALQLLRMSTFLEDTEDNRNLLRGYEITTEAVLVNYMIELAVYLLCIGYCIDLIKTI